MAELSTVLTIGTNRTNSARKPSQPDEPEEPAPSDPYYRYALTRIASTSEIWLLGVIYVKNWQFQRPSRGSLGFFKNRKAEDQTCQRVRETKDRQRQHNVVQ
jgi:hypothetical protein